MAKKSSVGTKAAAVALLGSTYLIGKGIMWFDREANNFPIPVGRAMDIAFSASRGRMTNRDYRDFSRVLPISSFNDESGLRPYPRR